MDLLLLVLKVLLDLAPKLVGIWSAHLDGEKTREEAAAEAESAFAATWAAMVDTKKDAAAIDAEAAEALRKKFEGA